MSSNANYVQALGDDMREHEFRIHNRNQDYLQGVLIRTAWINTHMETLLRVDFLQGHSLNIDDVQKRLPKNLLHDYVHVLQYWEEHHPVYHMTSDDDELMSGALVRAHFHGLRPYRAHPHLEDPSSSRMRSLRRVALQGIMYHMYDHPEVLSIAPYIVDDVVTTEEARKATSHDYHDLVQLVSDGYMRKEIKSGGNPGWRPRTNHVENSFERRMRQAEQREEAYFDPTWMRHMLFAKKTELVPNPGDHLPSTWENIKSIFKRKEVARGEE